MPITQSTSQSEIRRRRVLVLSGVSLAALAGCSGNDNTNTDEEDDADPDSGDSSSDPTGPTGTLRSFFVAVDKGDISEANSYWLSNAGAGDRPERQRAVEIVEIENRSIDQVSSDLGEETSSEEVRDFGERLAADYNNEYDAGISDWSYIYYNTEISGTREAGYAYLVKVTDGWKLGLLAAFQM